MFTLKIDTGNAAFDGGSCFEVARLLRDVAERLEDGERAGGVHDANGNTVGTFKLSGRERES